MNQTQEQRRIELSGDSYLGLVMRFFIFMIPYVLWQMAQDVDVIAEILDERDAARRARKQIKSEAK